MDFCARPNLLPVVTALAQMRQALTPVSDVETVALLDGLDRVLSSPIYSTTNVPNHDNSAMDGYALRIIDCEKPLRLIGEALAGHPFPSEISAGECVRITTGAALPAGADTVVMQEQVSVKNGSINLNGSPALGDNIRRAGEDIACNSLVLAQGHRITPIDIGLLASLGCAQIVVYRRLKVALLSTGDELTPLGKPLQAGNVYDSNRYTLSALLQRLNVEVIDLGLQPDEPEAIKASFSKVMQHVDAVISTGGVSVGDADYTKDVLAELGSIHFWKVAMKPGKPFAFGKLANGYFFGLPGNPVSAAVTYHQLVLPSLRYLGGELFNESLLLNAIAGQRLSKQPGRTDYQRGILIRENNINCVTSTGSQSSGVLTSMAQANCYIVLEQEKSSVTAGEMVNVLLFDKFIN